jgi:hypothetical protein
MKTKSEFNNQISKLPTVIDIPVYNNLQNIFIIWTYSFKITEQTGNREGVFI